MGPGVRLVGQVDVRAPVRFPQLLSPFPGDLPGHFVTVAHRGMHVHRRTAHTQGWGRPEGLAGVGAQGS